MKSKTNQSSEFYVRNGEKQKKIGNHELTHTTGRFLGTDHVCRSFLAHTTESPASTTVRPVQHPETRFFKFLTIEIYSHEL